MPVKVDLKDHMKTYGTHKVKLIATGEGFRNSVPVEFEVLNKPLIECLYDTIQVRNVLKGISTIDLYVDDKLMKSYEHDPDVTNDLTIDLNEFGIINDYHRLLLIVNTDYGSFESTEDYTSRILGVSGMFDEKVELTRTDKAVGLGYTIDASTGKVTSDFDNEFPYNEMEEVEIGGSKFISIPAMWFRIGKDENDNITDIAVSKQKTNVGNWFKSDAFLVGKYLAFNENGKMVSKSGKSTNYNYSATSWAKYAKANGEGYKSIGVYEHTILTFLWLIEFANKDSKSVMNGFSSYNKTTGATDSIEDATGFDSSSKSMKYRGIEDFVGNECEWYPDATANYYVTRDVENYKSGTASKEQLCYWKNVKSNLSWNWKGVQALGWDDNHPFFCLPSKLGASSQNTYFRTNMYGPYDSASYPARGKFYSSYNTNCNLISYLFEVSYDSGSDQTGSRLVIYEN